MYSSNNSLSSRQSAIHKSPAVFGFCIAALTCLAMTGCGYQTPLPDTAIAPEGAFGSNGDQDIAAVNLSSWALSSPRNTLNRPAVAARSIAAVDFLAGELESNPRWSALSPLVKMDMLQARAEIRNAVGIAPDARSQLVVNSLCGYALALVDGADQAQAGQYLTNAAFTLGPQATEARLQDLPFLSAANIATMRAAGAVGNGSGVNDGHLP